MGESISRKRPWVAAVLAAVATGLGHLYLRRWKRAIGWLLATFGVAVLFVEPATLESLAALEPVDPRAIAPLLVVASVSVADAYLVAHAQNAAARLSADPAGDVAACPHCGRELDPDLDFCHWCTAEVGEPGADGGTAADS